MRNNQVKKDNSEGRVLTGSQAQIEIKKLVDSTYSNNIREGKTVDEAMELLAKLCETSSKDPYFYKIFVDVTREKYLAVLTGLFMERYGFSEGVSAEAVNSSNTKEDLFRKQDNYKYILLVPIDNVLREIYAEYEVKQGADSGSGVSEIIIFENGELKGIEVTEEELLSLKKFIELIVSEHNFLNVDKDKISVFVRGENSGYIIISYEGCVFEESISNICSATFGEEILPVRDAIELNTTFILDNLIDMLEREESGDW